MKDYKNNLGSEPSGPHVDGDAIAKSSLAADALAAVYKTVIQLRSPGGCPWDREQTPNSLRGNLVEEAYELVDAIDGRSTDNIREELGDVLLLVAMISRCYEEDDTFLFADAINQLNDKLVRRHPHVFGNASAKDPDEVVKQWNEIKEKIEGKPGKTRLLDTVSRAITPLDRAFRLQKKASKAGFDWSSARAVLGKLREEIAEVEEVVTREEKHTDMEALESEVGDLLFSAVNVSRYLGVDPTVALNRTNRTFYQRFAHVEDEMKKAGVAMSAEEIDRMEALWQDAKSQ